mmetsp:Transcript_7413/g.24466  ORF Transcript_7413/g.24466 Transcript_7413/m.24466 type:complete len:188 (+) Transcript_7413:1051-1614(+)
MWWDHDARWSPSVAASSSTPPQVVTLEEVSYDRSEKWCSKPSSARSRRPVAKGRLFGLAANDATSNNQDYQTLDDRAKVADDLKATKDKKGLTRRVPPKKLDATAPPFLPATAAAPPKKDATGPSFSSSARKAATSEDPPRRNSGAKIRRGRARRAQQGRAGNETSAVRNDARGVEPPPEVNAARAP